MSFPFDLPTVMSLSRGSSAPGLTRQERNRRRQLEETGALQGLQNAVNIAKMFAEISRASTIAANNRRLEAAQRNIEVGTAQLELAETDERRRIAQALARHSGISRVNAAFRGTAAGRSTEQLQVGALGQAAQSASVVSANTAFRVQQLINENVVDLDDPNLAALEGGLRGFSVGMQIQSALDQLTTSHIVPITGHAPTGLPGDSGHGAIGLLGGQTIFTTPGIDFGSIFASGGDFNFDELLNL